MHVVLRVVDRSSNHLHLILAQGATTTSQNIIEYTVATLEEGRVGLTLRIQVLQANYNGIIVLQL